MPDPCHDRPRPLHPQLTDEEQTRLNALEKSFPINIFAYLGWLCRTMPEATGIALFVILVIGGSAFAAGTVVWLIVLAMEGWAWIPALLAGFLLATVLRPILRDAVATERRVRQSIKDKTRDKVGH